MTEDKYTDEMEKRLEEEKTLRPSPNSKDNKIDFNFIDRCLDLGDLGDGILYAEICRDAITYVPEADEWLTWGGHYWIQDKEKRRFWAIVEKVIPLLLDFLKELEIRKGKEMSNSVSSEVVKTRITYIEKKVQYYMKLTGQDKVIEASLRCERPLSVLSEKFDRNPYDLGCPNGVMDLRTGHFRPGRRNDWITKAAPIEWKGFEAPRERWRDFISTIAQRDKAVCDYIQRLLGYVLIGEVSEEIFIILAGAGRNGKTLFTNILSYVLGDLAGAVQSELLLSQRKSKSASAPSPEIMSLKGLRFAFASETEEGRWFSASSVKWLTGGDQLIARDPHGKYEVRFMPTHTLFLITNNLPKVNPNDFAFWERVHRIDFILSFVNREPTGPNERRADPELYHKLIGEASGILAWLVEGALAYQQIGLDTPDVIKNAVSNYRRGEDTLADFIDSEIDNSNPESKTSAKDVYQRYVQWFTTNNDGDEVPSQQRFGRLFGQKYKRESENGYSIYRGVKLKNG